MQRKAYSDPPILLLNIELELKSEKENAEVSTLSQCALQWDAAGHRAICSCKHESQLADRLDKSSITRARHIVSRHLQQYLCCKRAAKA